MTGPNNKPTPILDGFEPVAQFAASVGICERTVWRYRAKGLPWVQFAGRIYIGPDAEARAWLLKRVRRTTGGAK